MAALAVVLIAASFGYSALGTSTAATPGISPEALQQESPSKEANVADGEKASSAGSQSAGAEKATDGQGATPLPKLADFNSTVYTQYGDKRTLVDIADGKPLVINFWATWCPYCVQEMDDYQSIYEDYGDRVSFAFVDCADGQRETVDQGASWIFDKGYTLPVYFDTTQEAQYAYGASALPTTVVVSAAGEILDVSPGAIDASLMRSALDMVLDMAHKI